jgi:hypothetical protein
LQTLFQHDVVPYDTKIIIKSAAGGFSAEPCTEMTYEHLPPPLKISMFKNHKVQKPKVPELISFSSILSFL